MPSFSKMGTQSSRTESKPRGSRSVTVDTVENSWKTKIAHEPDLWFEYDVEGNYAVNLRCILCREYESSIRGMKYFNPAWVTGSTNYRSSNPVDHATGDPHQEAVRLYHRHCKTAGRERQPVDKSQKTIPHSMAGLMQKTREQLAKKFDIAYFVCKEEMPFTKYEKLVTLESKHGVDLCNEAVLWNIC